MGLQLIREVWSAICSTKPTLIESVGELQESGSEK